MKSYNIKFPLEDNVSTNSLFAMSVVTKDAYSSDLLLLLLTEKGQRYYQPDFGTNLNKFLFEPNDKMTQDDIVEDIKKTVSKFIPNLRIDSVKFNWNEDSNTLTDNSQLNLLIDFTYTEEFFNEQGQISINF